MTNYKYYSRLQKDLRFIWRKLVEGKSSADWLLINKTNKLMKNSLAFVWLEWTINDMTVRLSD